MRRQILLVSIVACAWLILVSTGDASDCPHAAEAEASVPQRTARKLMQEKQPGEKKGAGVKKPKKPADEEDDEDIRFMEEETAAAKEVDSGKDDISSTKAKTQTPVKKSKPAKKSGDAEAIGIENPDNGELKEVPGDAKKGKKAPGKVKARKPRRQPVEELAVEKIEDEDAEAAADIKKELPAAALVKKKKTDQSKPTEEGGAGHAEQAKVTKKKTDQVKKSTEKDAAEEDVQVPPKKKKTSAVPTEESADEEADLSKQGEEVINAELLEDDEIIPINIEEEDAVLELKEAEVKKEIKTSPLKRPPATSSKEQSKPKPKEKKESGVKTSKPVIDPKTTAPVKNSTKKSNDTKKKTGAPKKVEPLKETKPKKEQVPINFPERAAEDVEDLQVGSTATELEDEEEDINFVDEVTKLPSKFQETAGNVAKTLRPGIEKLSETSRTYFSSANEQMTQRFAPYVGEQVAPVVASLISYALLLIPLIVVLYMLERIRASLSLAKVLFFVNLYLGAYFVTLVLATFALHSEPMAFLFRNSRSSCIFLQLLQALGFLLYLVLYTVVFFKSCSAGGFLDKLASGFQWMIVALFGLHYYVTVFHKAMAMKLPRTNWKIYLVYSSAFAVLAMFARAKIELSKKEYYYSPVEDPDEVIPVDKRS